MLRLDFTAERRWIDILDGVRVLVDPFSSAILGRARAIQRRNGDPLPEEMDEAVEENFHRLSTAIAQVAIVEWEGVADKDGEPLPVSQLAVAGLMSIPACSEAFKIGYMLGVAEILAEKKGYSPSSVGTTGAVRVIAVPAARSAKPAPIQ